MMLSIRDMKRLEGVKCQLVDVVMRAAQLTDIPFNVKEGVRTIDRQRQLLALGKSRTMQSKHLTGEAVDLYPLTQDRKAVDWKGFERLAAVMKQAAEELGTRIEWGGDWVKFVDKPHFQLC
jgi:uncharacterized protein YcbK (DUF882 family)